jgi:hypothetical protein
MAADLLVIWAEAGVDIAQVAIKRIAKLRREWDMKSLSRYE